MKVRVMATLHIGESNLVTPVLDLKYPNSSSIMWGASALFPLKILGRAPMDWALAARGTGTWVMGVAGPPPGWPPLGGPPPGGHPPPPWLPPGGPPFHQSAAWWPAHTQSSGEDLPAGGTRAGAVGAPWGWEVLVWVVAIVVVCDILVLGYFTLSVAMLEHGVAGDSSTCMSVSVNLVWIDGETLCNGSIVLGGSSASGSCILWWRGSLVIGEFLTLAVSSLVSVSDSDSDSGQGSSASSSDPNSDSLSIGPSCSWMYSLLGLRYSCLVVLSWCSSHHCPWYSVMARGFPPSGGMYIMVSYPLEFLESNAETLLMCGLFATADPCQRSSMCVDVSQMWLLLVSLELAVMNRSRV